MQVLDFLGAEASEEGGAASEGGGGFLLDHIKMEILTVTTGQVFGS